MEVKINAMRTFPIFLILFLAQISVFGQDDLRAFGLNLFGEVGYTYPLETDATPTNGISPIFTVKPKDYNLLWHARDNSNTDKLLRSYSYGASLFYTHSTRKFYLITLDAGIKQSKLVYYYDVVQSHSDNFGTPINYFQEWFYINQPFFNFQVSYPLGTGKSLFAYTKIGGTYSWVGEGKNPFERSSFQGITKDGVQNWNDRLFITDDVVDKNIFGLVGGAGLQFNLGAARQHSFFGGVNFYYSLGDMINTSYGWMTNLQVDFEDEVAYQGHSFMLEFGYRIPLIRKRNRIRRPTEKTGNLTVFLEPSAASNSGAAWRVDGGTWRYSSSKVKLSEGSHSVDFKRISGYTTPSSSTVYIYAGANETVRGYYRKHSPTPPPPPKPSKGSIKVNISPYDAISDGAMWRLDNGHWIRSGESVGNLSVGNHTIEYKDIPGWAMPSRRNVYVRANQTENIKGIYTFRNVPTQVEAILEESMKNCFNKPGKEAKYHEDDLKVNNGKVKIEFYAPDSDDGDVITVCVGGQVILENHEITTEGEKISIDMSGKNEEAMVIYANKGGSDSRIAIGIQVIEGSVKGDGANGQEVTFKMDKKGYYWFKIIQ